MYLHHVQGMDESNDIRHETMTAWLPRKETEHGRSVNLETEDYTFQGHDDIPVHMNTKGNI